MRNPEYQFVSTDTSALLEEMKADYETLTGVSPEIPEKLILSWVASVLLKMLVKLNYAANQNLPSRAEGQNLDALAELFFARQRTPAVPASCTVRFFISAPRQSATLIPAGTRVTNSSQTLYWETTISAYVAPGNTYADVTVQCQSAGTVGNGWEIGSITSIVDVFDYYQSCENITVSDGGANEQTDEELYDAMIASMSAPSTAGARNGYAYYAKSVSTQIADVAVTSPEPGEVRIYALMKDGSIASSTMKQAIYNACNAEDVRPLADHLTVDDPVVLHYNIDLTYWLYTTTIDAAAVQNAVQEAVNTYIQWQSAKLGRDINPSVLIGLLMQTGIKRVEVREPAYTPVNTDGGTSAPVVALIANAKTDVVIINGGQEDE